MTDPSFDRALSHPPRRLFLHGVPCNRAQWEEVQRRVAVSCETISIDMLRDLRAIYRVGEG